MTFLRIVIPLYLFCLSMIAAQTLRVCREGKPVPTFPDHAPASSLIMLFGFARKSLSARWNIIAAPS
jgi:hypothetical protein